MQLALLKIGELAQAHLNDGAGLHLVEAKTLTQTLAGFIGGLARPDDVHHLVDVVAGDNQALQDVGAVLRLFQLKLGTAYHHLVTVIEEVLYQLLEVDSLGATIDQAHVVNTERRLQLRHLVELVEQHIGILVLLHINHYAHALAVALVVDIADAVDAFLLNQTRNGLDELALVDIVGDLGYHNLVAIVFGLNLGLSAHHNASTTRLEGIFHALVAIDDATCGEVGRFDVVHELGNRNVRILKHGQAAVD